MYNPLLHFLKESFSIDTLKYLVNFFLFFLQEKTKTGLNIEIPCTEYIT